MILTEIKNKGLDHNDIIHISTLITPLECGGFTREHLITVDSFCPIKREIEIRALMLCHADKNNYIKHLELKYRM